MLAQIVVACRPDLMKFALDNGADRNVKLEDNQHPFIITDSLGVSDWVVYGLISEKYYKDFGDCFCVSLEPTGVRYSSLTKVINMSCDGDIKSQMLEIISE